MELLNTEKGFILGMEFAGILNDIQHSKEFSNKLFHTKNIDVPRALDYYGYTYEVTKLCDTWSLIVFGKKTNGIEGESRSCTT